MYFIYTLYTLSIINIFDVTFAAISMPDEGAPHIATWMAYGATKWTWGTQAFFGVSRLIARKDLMRLAANIARYENVKMLINEEDQTEANTFLAQVKNEDNTVTTSGKVLPPIGTTYTIELITQFVDDLWTRDTGPIFVYDNKATKGVNFNFNGWGQANTGATGWAKDPMKAANGVVDQPISNDKLVADFILQRVKATEIKTWLVLEGGCFEVNGKGTAIATESSIINNNRNPGKSKSDIEAEMVNVLGLKKVIWLPGLKGMDVTDGHVDFYARFVTETKVVCFMDPDIYSPEYNVTQTNYQILSAATDALGNKLTVVQLIKPNSTLVKATVIARNGWANVNQSYNSNAFASSYVGFYVGNNFVVMPKFGDDSADTLAFNTISGLFPSRTVMQITSDGIANGGGSIHCATQQQIVSATAKKLTLSYILLFIIPVLTCLYQLAFL